jgi:ATP-dependent DNA ligase
MPQVCHEASPVLRITGGREPRGSLHTGRPEPFDSDQFIFELKIDGFRALAHIENGKGELISRNGNVFRGLADLSAWIAEHLRLESAVLDGEIACVDDSGRPVDGYLRLRDSALNGHRI